MSDVVRKIMSNLRDAVGQADDIDSSTKRKLLEGVESAVKKEPIPTLVIIGETGVGKTTSINALFNAGEEVGHAVATTKTAVGIDVTVDRVRGARGDLRVFDMPGLGDHHRNYAQYIALYREVLPLADVILWVHPAPDRMVQFVQQSIVDIFGPIPQLLPRVVFGLNKGDEIHPRDWNPVVNLPSEQQEQLLKARTQDFSRSVQDVFRKWTPPVVAYSALQRYNLPLLFKTLMTAVPAERRWVLESRMELADFLALVDKGLVEAAERHVHSLPQPGAARPMVPEQATPAKNKLPERFEQYLAALPEKDYIALVADRRRLLEVMREWGVGR